MTPLAVTVGLIAALVVMWLLSEWPLWKMRREDKRREKRKRTSARQFLKEVRQELKKVDWPTREELISYTVVVLVTVIVMTTLVFALDYVFTKIIFNVLN